MSMIDQRPPGGPGCGSSRAEGPTRLERRAVLDVSVDDELLRGELRGAELTAPLKDTLSILVAHELADGVPLPERMLVGSGPLGGLFAASRRLRRLETLIGMNLVRRAGGGIRPTVAGIAASRRFSTLPASEQPPRDLLRSLRRSEIGSILR